MQPVTAQMKSAFSLDISRAVELAIQFSPPSHREGDRVAITKMISSVFGLSQGGEFAEVSSVKNLRELS